MGKGTNTTTQTKQSTPGTAPYTQQALNMAQAAASTPYQAYGGPLTAGMDPRQEGAFSAISNAAGFAVPYINEASQFARTAATPITGANIGQYMDPYTQQVVNATQAQFANQNAYAQSELAGNAAARGALGGDRRSIAAERLAGEHARAQNPVIAGLYSQGWQGAAKMAADEKLRQAQVAGQLGGFGVQGAQAGLAGAQAMFGAGGQYQATTQREYDALRAQYEQAKAYPFQQAQWYANLVSGADLGRTTTGEMTKPEPDRTGQYLGAAVAAAPFIMSDARVKDDIQQIGTSNDGLPIYRFKYSDDPNGGTQIGLMAQDVEQTHPEAVAEFGGIKHIDPQAATEEAAMRPPVQGFAAGGVAGSPWEMAPGWIPQSKPVRGGTPDLDLDKWPTETDQSTDFSKYAKLGQAGVALGNKARDWWSGGDSLMSTGGQGILGGGTGGPPAPYPMMAARGGAVWEPGGYEDGGALPWAPDRTVNEQWPGIRDELPIAGFSGQSPRGSALDEAVRGFQELYNPPPLKLPPTQRLDEGWDAARKAMAGGEDATWSPWTRGASDSPGIPKYPESVGYPPAPPEAVPTSPSVNYALPGTDEEALPEDISDSRRVPRVAGMAPPADYRARYASPGEPAAAPASKRGFGLLGMIDDATAQAMMAGGFGMMASRSPHLGSMIGEGGLAGMAGYAGARAAERQAEEQRLSREQTKREFDLKVDRLQKEADHFARSHDLALRKQKFDEMKPVMVPAYDPILGVTRNVAFARNADGTFSPLDPKTGEKVPGIKMQTPGGAVPSTPAPAGTPQPPRSVQPAPAAPAAVAEKPALPIKEYGKPYEISSASAKANEETGKYIESFIDNADNAARRKIRETADTEKLEALEKYDANLARHVVRVGEGQEPAPSPSSLRGQQGAYMRNVMNYVREIYPDFSQEYFDMKKKTRQAFINGVEGRQVRSLNTVLSHIGELYLDGRALDNFRSGSLGPLTSSANEIMRWYRANSQDPRIKSYLGNVQAVATELEKSFKGSNPALTAINDWKHAIGTPSITQEELAAVTKKMIGLIGGQLESSTVQYAAGMRAPIDLTSLLTPSNRVRYERIQNDKPPNILKFDTPKQRDEARKKRHIYPGEEYLDAEGNLRTLK